MNLKYIAAVLAIVSLLFVSCDDDTSGIGSSLTKGEVTITVDSITPDLKAETVEYESFDGRNTTKLLGRINVPEFGSLSCSFVSQMLSSTASGIPDSIAAEDVDSMRLMISVPRGSLTGDSLAPQQLKVYELTKQLPSDINTLFNPDGYYDNSSLLGSTTYTLSVIAQGDSVVKDLSTYPNVRIPVNVSRDFALELLEKYRDGDKVFEWPSTFNEYFPGIYVEQPFGNGCIANVSAADFYTYWHYTTQEYKMQEDSTYAYVDKIVRDSVCWMSSQPEVISSNIIDFKISDYIRNLVAEGNEILTTPGGYRVDITLPVNDLIDSYLSNGSTLSTVSSLTMSIPASVVKNDYGLTVAPYLLMVKKSERETFFDENKLPDGTTSFYAEYDSDTGTYSFNSMRAYFVDLLENVESGGEIDAEDMEFSLVPVDITTEEVSGYYTSTTYVTKCMPYLLKPTMTQLHTENAVICFTYTSQQIY